MLEQHCGDGEEDARESISENNHRLAADDVEKGAQQNGAEHVAKREGEQIPAHAIGGDAIELLQHQTEGEEADRVVEKGLRDHQRQAQQRALAVGDEHDVRNVGQRSARARMDGDRRSRADFDELS